MEPGLFMKMVTDGMNTRVQAYPAEVQTGIDIVKEQLWIAFTGDTALKQSDINPDYF